MTHSSNCDSHADTRTAAASWIYAASFEPNQLASLLNARLEELFPNAKLDDATDIVKLQGKYASITPELIDAFIAHTQRFAAQGAPFEWIDATTARFSGRLYGTSAALPLEGCTRAMAARGSNS